MSAGAQEPTLWELPLDDYFTSSQANATSGLILSTHSPLPEVLQQGEPLEDALISKPGPQGRLRLEHGL